MTPVPAPSPGLPRRGTERSRALAHRVLGLFGWRVTGALPDLPKFVLIVAPHTSNWDFPIGALAMFATGLRASWLGKHTIFFWPASYILRWMGGEPIDRAAAHGTVETAIHNFQSRPQWVLALSPEGTRRRMEQWKTGFYRIATGAGVPIVPVWIDYRTRELHIAGPVTTTGDMDADLRRLRGLFSKEMAKYPEKFAELPASQSPSQPAAG